MNNNRIVIFRKLTRLAYLLGVAFLLTGMVLSMVSYPSMLALILNGINPV